MDGDNDTPDNGAPDAAADTPASSESFTRSQLEAEIQRAKDAAWAEARRTFQRQSGKPDKGNTTPDKSVTPGNDRAIKRRDALDDALGGLSVTPEQRRALRDLIDKVDPDEPDAWAKSTVGTFLKAGEPSQPDKQAPAPMSRNTGDAGAPQGIPVWERPSNPFEWTVDDLQRLEAQKGRREAQKIIRRKAEEFARNMTIRLHSPRER